MYQIGDKFYNVRRGGILTVIDAVADRVYGLGDVPFIRHKYCLQGGRTGLTTWVSDDDIEDWLERGVLSVSIIEPLRWIKPLTLTTI